MHEACWEKVPYKQGPHGIKLIEERHFDDRSWSRDRGPRPNSK